MAIKKHPGKVCGVVATTVTTLLASSLIFCGSATADVSWVDDLVRVGTKILQGRATVPHSTDRIRIALRPVEKVPDNVRARRILNAACKTNTYVRQYGKSKSWVDEHLATDYPDDQMDIRDQMSALDELQAYGDSYWADMVKDWCKRVR